MANKSKKSLDINGLEYVASKVMTLVNSGGTADYLVEEGTEGIWTYRKWATGIAECWGEASTTVTSWDSWGVLYESNALNVALPSGLFISTPNVTMSPCPSDQAYVSARLMPCTNTQITYQAFRPNSGSTSSKVATKFNVKGLWKEFTPDIMKTPSLDLYYPVGSIYQTSNANFDPNVTFGGTWELITNKFLIGAGDEYENGAEGGEATHTLTVDEIPNHDHQQQIGIAGYDGWPTQNIGYMQYVGYSNPANRHSTYTTVPYNTAGRGGGQAHNNLPPYKAVFMWERTA